MALNNIFGKIKQYAGQNPDKARDAIDKVSKTVDEKTGGKYSDKIQKAGDAAGSGLGLNKNPQADQVDGGSPQAKADPAQPKPNQEGGAN